MTAPAERVRRGRRIEAALARRLLGLPPGWQVRLSRQPPVILDGLTLDPGLQLLLALWRRRGGPPTQTLSPPAARRRARRDATVAAGRPVAVRSVTELTLPGAAGPLRARHYAPPEPGGPHPLLLFLHGGGFVIGDVDTHDQACRMLARHAGVHVLSAEYRLAPEDPFPAAVDDALAAWRWAAGNAGRLGADPARVAIGGDSAGGNLAAVVSQLTAADGGPVPVLQVLLYPTVDSGAEYPSLELFADGFFLTRDEMDWFEANYSAGVDRMDPRLNPIHGRLAGLAPAFVVTAGFDPLRDEGEAYAAALAAAGTEVTLRREPGMIHGFVNMVGLAPSARAAVVAVAGQVRDLLAVPPVRPRPAGAPRPAGVRPAGAPRSAGERPAGERPGSRAGEEVPG